MQVPLRVLIAEDSEDDARLLLRELQQAGYQPTYERVDTPAAMTSALDRHAWDLGIGDYSRPAFSGPAPLAPLRARDPDTPVIFVSCTIARHVRDGAARGGGSTDQARRPHLTSQVVGDPQVQTKEWAQREEMVAFAGYPLVVQERVLGVMAMFARHSLSEFVPKALASVASALAVGIERKRAEEALRSSEERLRQAQKMEAVGRLAGGVAHDFNNLLTVITSYSALLLEDLAADDPKRDDVDQIRKAAEGAAALTRQLLAFSRQQVLQPKALDLKATVAGTDKLLKRLIGDDIRLTAVLPRDLRVVQPNPCQLDHLLITPPAPPPHPTPPQPPPTTAP